MDSRPALLEKVHFGEDRGLALRLVSLAGDKVVRPSGGDLADELYAFARRNMRVFVRDGPPRTEVPQFSERALFEAIVNAVVHRDYSVYGSRIRLFIFDDRLELYSPGALPNTLSVESIAVRQSTRNEAVKSILVKLPVGEAGQGSGRGYFMEAQGDGVPVILRETRALAGKDAVWRVIDDSEVVLTLPSASEP